MSTNARRSTAAERTGEREALECMTGDPVLHPCSRPCYPVLLLLPFYTCCSSGTVCLLSPASIIALLLLVLFFFSLSQLHVFLASSFLRHWLLFHDLAVACTWFIAYTRPCTRTLNSSTRVTREGGACHSRVKTAGGASTRVCAPANSRVKRSRVLPYM